MVQIAKNMGLSNAKINDCFMIGYNQYIGYEFTKSNLNHNKVAWNILNKKLFQ